MRNPLKEIFDFQEEEFPVAVLAFSFFFLVIAAFQITKSLKDGLFNEYYGADVELYAKLANIVLAALAAVAFSLLYTRLGRRRLILVLAAFFVVSFLLLAVTLPAGDVRPSDPGFSDHLSAWGFYFLGDLISTLLVVAFWAYVTDVFTSDQSKRLFGFIGGGAVTGGLVGITTAKFLLSSIGMRGLLLLTAVAMLALIAIISALEARLRQARFFEVVPAPSPGVEVQPKSAAAVEGARLVFNSGYLAAIVGIMGFYEVASQVMDYQFKLATEGLEGVQATQAHMVNVRFYANILSVTVQFVVVPIVFKRFGLIPALLILPVSIIAGSVGFLAAPTLLMASLLVAADNGLNYSIQQTSRETLYIPTTPDEKYKARAFTNMFVYRFAKGVAIFTVMALGALGVTVGHLSLITITVMALMIFCGVYAGRQFADRTRVEERRRAA